MFGHFTTLCMKGLNLNISTINAERLLLVLKLKTILELKNQPPSTKLTAVIHIH